MPLHVLCGASLTKIASAALTDPRIAGQLTLVWMGGPKYPGRALPLPPGTPLKYNLGIAIRAAWTVVNRTRYLVAATCCKRRCKVSRSGRERYWPSANTPTILRVLAISSSGLALSNTKSASRPACTEPKSWRRL
jgi:hypothetical protein